MGAIASQITSLTIVYATVHSDANQRKHQSSASLAFVRGIHRGPVNSPHKWPVTRKMLPFDDVMMAMTEPGPLFTKTKRLIGMGIPILNMRRSSDSLRFIMGTSIPVKGSVLVNRDPGITDWQPPGDPDAKHIPLRWPLVWVYPIKVVVW